MIGRHISWKERRAGGRHVHASVHQALGERLLLHPRWSWRLCAGIHALPRPGVVPYCSWSYEVRWARDEPSPAHVFEVAGDPEGFTLADAVPCFWDGVVDFNVVRELLEHEHGPVELRYLQEWERRFAWVALIDDSVLGAAENELDAFRLALDAPPREAWPNSNRWAPIECAGITFAPAHTGWREYWRHATPLLGRWESDSGALVRAHLGWKYYTWTRIPRHHVRKLRQRVIDIQRAPCYATPEEAVRNPV